MQPLELVVDNRVRLRSEGLDLGVQAELKEACTHDNPQFHLMRAIGKGTWGVKRTISTWRAEHAPNGDRVLTFPRGALSRVREVLADAGLDWAETDDRQPGEPADVGELTRQPWEHQRELVAAALQKQNCILRAPTGSGKTTTAFALLSALKRGPAVVLVPTKGIFKQWVDRATKELGLPKNRVGQVRAGKWVVHDLTVAMQKTFANAYAKGDPRAIKLAEEAAVVIADEVHLFAAATFIDAVDPFRAKYRVGVSDDHTRRDKKEFLIHDLFGDVAASVDRARLVEAGIILDVEVRVLLTGFEAKWYGMPDEDDDSDEEPKELDFNRLLVEMGADAKRTELALGPVCKEVAAGEQVLVMTHHKDLVRSIDQELARRNVRTGFLVGDAEHEFDATIAGLRSKSIQAAVGTYQAMGTGLDLPAVGVGVAVTPIASRQFFSQVRGRLCRSSRGKSSARLYYLFDQSLFGLKHLRKLAAWNRKVVVWQGGSWVDVKTLLRTKRNARSFDSL